MGRFHFQIEYSDDVLWSQYLKRGRDFPILSGELMCALWETWGLEFLWDRGVIYFFSWLPSMAILNFVVFQFCITIFMPWNVVLKLYPLFRLSDFAGIHVLQFVTSPDDKTRFIYFYIKATTLTGKSEYQVREGRSHSPNVEKLDESCSPLQIVDKYTVIYLDIKISANWCV